MIENLERRIRVVISGVLVGLSALVLGCNKKEEGILVIDITRGAKNSSIYLDDAFVKQVSEDSSRDLVRDLMPRSYEVKVENKDYPKIFEKKVAIFRGEETKLNVYLGLSYEETKKVNRAMASKNFKSGMDLYYIGKLDEAIAEFRKALEIDSDYADAHRYLGDALKDKKDFSGAILYYRRALEIDPDYSNNVEISLSLGEALYWNKDLDGAIIEFRKVLEIDSDYVDAHKCLGFIFDKKKDLDGAIAEFRKALEIEPNNAYIHYRLGGVLEDKGDLDGAIAEYRRILEIDPDYRGSGSIHVDIGEALEKKGDLDGAIAEYRIFQKIYPTPWVENMLNRVLKKKSSQ